MTGIEARCRCFEKVGVERADSPSGTAWEDVLARVHSLSRREVETFRLLAGGGSNRLIAAALRVKERTVKAYVAQILAKLDLESRLQAGIVAFACAALAENGGDMVLPCPPVKVRVMALHPPADLPHGVPLKVQGSAHDLLVGFSRHSRGGLVPMYVSPRSVETSPYIKGGAMAEARRKFDQDLMEGAVRLVRETGKPIAQVAEDVGINEGTLGNWVNTDRRRRGEGNGALGEDERAEPARLRRENDELAMGSSTVSLPGVKDAMGR